jgi:hypothetical protein
VTRAKICIPRSQLQRDLRDESNVLVKKLRPVLNGFRLGAVVTALAALEAEAVAALLAAESAGCDCIADAKHDLHKCESRSEHALTTQAVGR